ncbi:MAG TPA: class I SAM-dependent methyltransferase, partial [Anaerolineaceae bacterium]|nr:class I SAM-dependent methyltransferase [Anaerolineaceae bacterium]
PFCSSAFSGVVSGYLLRNVSDLDRTLQEQQRVLLPAGRIAALDTTRPAQNLLLPWITFYYKYIIPLLGKIIAGDAEAYTYLPETSARFLDAEELAGRIIASGFKQVGFVRRMFGTMAIHFGKKQSSAIQ